MSRRLLLMLCGATFVVSGYVVVTAALLDPLVGRQVLPSTNWWNLDVSAAPADPRSAAFIDFVSGRTAANPTAVRTLHPDFGPPPYGMPYVDGAGHAAPRSAPFRSLTADDFEVIQLGWNPRLPPAAPTAYASGLDAAIGFQRSAAAVSDLSARTTIAGCPCGQT